MKTILDFTFTWEEKKIQDGDAIVVKGLADLKVQIIAKRDKRKSPASYGTNLWCTTCGELGHANTDVTNKVPTKFIKLVRCLDGIKFLFDPTYFQPIVSSIYNVYEGPTQKMLIPMPMLSIRIGLPSATVSM